MAAPHVTLVVVPRDRFSRARESLESIYDHTQLPFRLVYVDAGSPTRIKRYLRAKALERGFQLIRTEQYLSPNRARNLGRQQAETKYIAFIENDVLVSPGWLEGLLRCAEGTGAWVTGPLYLMGKAEHRIIHMAGGISHIQSAAERRILYEKDHLPGMPLADVEIALKREPCELVEFHCMLVRTDVFERIGPLDERLLSVREQDDFCLSVREAGGTIYFEPQAVVTYLPPPPITLSDLAYYKLRWSEEWIKASLERFHKKWNLDMDENHPHYTWLWQRRDLFFHQFTRPLRPLRTLASRVLKRPSHP